MMTWFKEQWATRPFDVMSVGLVLVGIWPLGMSAVLLTEAFIKTHG